MSGNEVFRKRRPAPAEAAEDWPEPSMSVAEVHREPPPALPLTVFGEWAADIEAMAQASNAPPDYVAPPLLASVLTLISNIRGVGGHGTGYEQAAAGWFCLIGGPATGKNAGSRPILKGALAKIEEHLGRDYEQRLQDWEQEVALAAKDDDGRKLPPKPRRPAVVVNDTTPQALARIMASQPRGVLLSFEELSRHLVDTTRAGSENAGFYLECFDGGRYTVHRVKFDEAMVIPRLTASIIGAMTPDNTSMLVGQKDDGAVSRYLFTWPTPVEEFRLMPRADMAGITRRLQRLVELPIDRDEFGAPTLRSIPFSPGAAAVITEMSNHWGKAARSRAGLVGSSYSRASGQAARLALALTYLTWCRGGSGPEPSEISERTMADACLLMDAYFLPMMERVLAEANEPAERRAARLLATWVLQHPGETVLTTTMLRDRHRIAGLRDTSSIKAALRYLVQANWLRTPDYTGATGRPREEWYINPRVHLIPR